MAFSFFGKKNPPPAKSRVAARDTTVPRAGAEVMSQPAATPKPAQPPRSDIPPRNVGIEVGISQAGGAKADGLSKIELVEGGDGVHPAVEEAAILYANGNDPQALQTLEAAVMHNDLGQSGEQIWFMLFDIYQVLGKQEAFDSRAVDYAVKFDKSPPTWSGPGTAAASGAAGSIPLAALGPGLDRTSEKQFEMLARMISKAESVRVDVGRVKSADDRGCGGLLEVLRVARKAKREVIMQNAATLTRVLEARIATGKRENPNVWLLLLELYQQQGLQDKFDECALNYAITFEVSPPSWEPLRPKAKPAAVAATPVAATTGAFALQGELSGASTNILQGLKDYAREQSLIVIDLAQLRRIDFVCAGNLLNVLFGIVASGKSVRMTGASALVVALLNAVGISQVVTVERRRY